MIRNLSWVALALLAVQAAPPGSAQQISIDWSRETVSCPDTIDYPTRVAYVVREVNDMLFDYRVQVDLRPRETFDFEMLRVDPTKVNVLVDTCESKAAAAAVTMNEVAEEFEKVANLKPTCDSAKGQCESVSLARTLGSWREFESAQKGRIETVSTDVKKAEEIGNCTDASNERIKEIRGQLLRFEKWRERAHFAHEIRGTISLGPDVDVDVTVYELYTEGGVRYPTDRNGKKFTCTPKSNFLTLSAGTLVSTLSNRTFRTVAVPKTVQVPDPTDPSKTITQTTNETFNALAVDNGNNFSPHASALLNYKLPTSKLPTWMGFTISSGPVYRLAGNTQAASLGLFAGVSWTLADRLFVTPGLHVAEFTDFPLGYSGGSFVPSGIGDPSPIKRWTGRFGVSISYRARNLSGPKIDGTANNLPKAPIEPAADLAVVPLKSEIEQGKDLTLPLKATGGTPPYTWTVKDAGTLPKDVKGEGAVLKGKVSAEAGEYKIPVAVKDKDDKTATGEVSIVVTQPK